MYHCTHFRMQIDIMIRAIITAAQAALPMVTSISIFVETMCRAIFTVRIYHVCNSIHQSTIII